MSSEERSFSGFSTSARLGIPPNNPNRLMLTEKTYKGSPRMIQRTAIQKYLMNLGNQGRSVARRLWIFFLIVSVEEAEVFIEGFVTIEDIEVIFRDNKVIEF